MHWLYYNTFIVYLYFQFRQLAEAWEEAEAEAWAEADGVLRIGEIGLIYDMCTIIYHIWVGFPRTGILAKMWAFFSCPEQLNR